MRRFEIVGAARQHSCSSIAYTYTEPTIFFEYAYDTARLAFATGLANIFVTNGYMTGEMLQTFTPYLDAANVDLKAFRDQTYRKYVGAKLQPVLDSLKAIEQLGIWLEVTTLVIPGINDEPEELQDAAQFIVRELGADTPWHISRFFPDYKLRDVPPTPHKSLERAWEIGKSEGLRYVYLGNVLGEDKQNTYCPDCGTLLIRRNIFGVVANRIRSGCCPDCSCAIAGVGISEKSQSASVVTRQE
ncbi:MAG: AmmeMemoRadiSam system radical SAM enzyme [Xenococcaceae cyanobacterium MO_234.B1]|nr:AmmeMemoRadiSam system radical SAM enzyme [Xenococcaceae cyanobacterium MO_234.B1]